MDVPSAEDSSLALHGTRPQPAPPRPRRDGWLIIMLSLTGGGLALYHRPGGRGFWAGTHPERIGFHITLEHVLAWSHRLIALVALVSVSLWAWQAWRRRQTQPPILPIGWALLLAVALATSFLVPWQDYLPWSQAVRTADLTPTRQGDREGPFQELIGLRAVYPADTGDGAWPTHLSSQRGSVLAWVHALIGPIGMLAALVVQRVHRVRQPRERQRQRELADQ